jgi:two-component system, OmpR family, alkaline phosphatase synthesis response regulator PhoP
MSKKILVVDDERDLNELVSYNLEKEGFQVVRAYNGEDALRQIFHSVPDLVVLDLMLPEIDGWEVCKRLRADNRTKQVPIIMLTARADETDKILGLELGADDYMVKPFSQKELVARIKAIFRRETRLQEKSQNRPGVRWGELEIDREKYEVKYKNKQLVLTNKEFELLYLLVSRPDRVVTREVLLDEIWHMDSEVETRTVDVHVRRLRKKMGRASQFIKTVRGVGYKFNGNEDR